MIFSSAAYLPERIGNTNGMKKKSKYKRKLKHTPPVSPAGGHTSVQRNTIFVSVVTSFISTFMGSALNLSIPAIEKEFHAGAAAVGWIITIYMLTCAALAVPFGRLADLVSRKRILWLGILLFTLSSAAAVLSSSMKMLLLLRFLQGAGASMIFSTNVAILVGAFDEGERGKVLGYATSATYVGMSAGPVLGGVLNHHFGWRAVFAAAAAGSAVALYSAVRKLPERAPAGVANGFQERPMFDMKGSLLYVSGIAAVMYGLSVIMSKACGWAVLLAGGGLLLWFVHVEQRAETPVVKLSLFRRNPPYIFSNLAAMVSYGTNFAVSYLLSIYLQVVKGYSSQTAGLILITAPAVQALLSIVMGRLSDKHSPNLLSAMGMGVCAAALLFYAFLSEEAPVGLLMAALAVTGVGFAMFASPNTNAVMACVRKSDYSVASSLLATMRSMGHTVSMAIVTMVVSLYMGAGSLSEAPAEVLLQTMHTSFFVFSGLCILGIFMAFQRKV